MIDILSTLTPMQWLVVGVACAIVLLLALIRKEPPQGIDLCDCAASEPMPIEKKREHMRAGSAYGEPLQ